MATKNYDDRDYLKELARETTAEQQDYQPAGSSSEYDRYTPENLGAARDYAASGNWGAALDSIYGSNGQSTDFGSADYSKSSSDIIQELYDSFYTPNQPSAGDLPAPETKPVSRYGFEGWQNGSQEYGALRDMYTEDGRRAMRDTLGEASARTGGLASSYAISAGQQRYNDYMSRLTEIARSMYEGGMDDARNRLTNLLAQGNSLDSIPADIIAGSGLTEMELNALAQQYAPVYWYGGYTEPTKDDSEKSDSGNRNSPTGGQITMTVPESAKQGVRNAMAKDPSNAANILYNNAGMFSDSEFNKLINSIKRG